MAAGASSPAIKSGEAELVVRDRGGTRSLFADLPPGHVLDVPAGGGLQTAALVALGFRVCSVDLFPRNRPGPGQSWICADANDPLPFRTSRFDYLLCREGIEHLEDQMGFLRECARVLKPGGKLILTTPNVMHLAARMSAFLTGQRNLRRGLVNEVQTLRGRNGARIYHGHAFLLDYFRARYMIRLAGFDKLGVYTDHMSPTAIAAAPLIPFLWIAMKFSIAVSARNARKPGRKKPSEPVLREITRHVLSPALLFGKRMIIVADRI
ncbi:MAG: class I SAM-dependent methyltransferase [Candidatus Binataceae bacterium]